MNMFRVFFYLVGITWLVAATHPVHAQLIYFEDNGGGAFPRGLYDFDPGTGRSSLRARVAQGPTFNSLARQPSDGTVFGVDATTASLYTIDINTGRFTLVTALDLSFATIAFHPSTGVLYGLPLDSSLLYEIDPEVGSSTLIGNVSPVRGGLAFAPDGTLYGFNTLDSVLYRIALPDALVFIIGGSGLAPGTLQDAALTPDGELFITDLLGFLFRVDLSNGQRSRIAETGMSRGLYGLLAEGLPSTPAIGGSVDDMLSRLVVCHNDTSEETVSVPLAGNRSWDCTDAFAPEEGDVVVQTIEGVAFCPDAAAATGCQVGGQVRKIQGQFAFCFNQSNAQTAWMALDGDSRWVCDGDFEALEGDLIIQTVIGTAMP